MALFLTLPDAVSTPEDESDEEIVGILSELSSSILELIDKSYHDEVVGEIEYPDYTYHPFWIPESSCLEESEGERIDMYHREEEFLIVYLRRVLILLSKKRSNEVVHSC